MKCIKEITYHNKSLHKDILSALQNYKIVKLQGYSGNNLYEFYDKLSEEIGHWVPMDEDVTTGNKTGKKWIEVRYDPEFPNSYRHSSTRQPLHTDGSYEQNAPEITFFFCIKNAPIGGATIFLDSKDLIVCLETYSPDLLQRCLETPLTFYKGNDSKTRPIITEDSKGTVLTWNYFRLAESELRNQFHQFLEEKMVGGGICHPIQLMPGEAVFFHDERLLHGRNSFIANKAGDRNLLKGGLCLT